MLLTDLTWHIQNILYNNCSNIIFSSVRGTFTKTDYVLIIKYRSHKFQMIEKYTEHDLWPW